MQINEKIRQARTLKGWSQKEIADKLEESRSTYAEWERDTVPSFDIIVKIAATTGISILEFVAAVDEKVARGAYSDEKPALLQKPSADFLAGKLESKEETIQQIEARRQDAEAHYKDMKDALERAQMTIIEVLKPIKEKTEKIETNSDAILNNLARLERVTRVDDLSMMEGTDKILGREPGTTSLEAGIVEHALEDPDGHVDTNVSTRNEGNVGKGRQKGKA